MATAMRQVVTELDGVFSEPEVRHSNAPALPATACLTLVRSQIRRSLDDVNPSHTWDRAISQSLIGCSVPAPVTFRPRSAALRST